MTHFNEMRTISKERGLLSDLASFREITSITIAGAACFFSGAVFERMSVSELHNTNPVPQQLVYGKFGHVTGKTAISTTSLAIDQNNNAKPN